MNTHGHEDVAETAGTPLLEEVFKKDKDSLKALYLGNWLTDVSQFVDPVAYASISNTLKEGIGSGVDALKKSIDQMIEEMMGTIFDERGRPAGRVIRKILGADPASLETYARKAKQALFRSIDFLAASQMDERDPRFARFFRDIFLIKGYFKFVHPEATDKSPRLDFEAFMHVFGRAGDTQGRRGNTPALDRPGAYTQYYPHEHVDRPELLPSQDPKIFAPGRQLPNKPFQLPPGGTPGTRSPRNRKRIEPDLYGYLRDHIQMTAGLLAEVDLEFKKAIRKGIQKNDADWYVTLAKLGHALHQVEDFFAHSNWVELAGQRLGPAFLSKVIPHELPLAFVNRAHTVVQKRLRRQLTDPLPKWDDHPPEKWVVTGYFDWQDTILSVMHFAEEGLGADITDPYQTVFSLVQDVKEGIKSPRTVEHKAQKTIHDTLEFLTRPKRALEDNENEVAQSLKKTFGDDVEKLRRPGVSRAVAGRVMRETSYLSGLPEPVQAAFLNVIVEGSRAYTVHEWTNTIFETLDEISSFFKSPIKWLAGWLPKQLLKVLLKSAVFYARERFYDWVGADRIGCHSLMAKDHGVEPFYKYQKECAIALHWYIVKTLLRWKENKDAEYIDWLELLEYFLRNPLSLKSGSSREVEVVVPVTIVHTVKYGEQLKTSDLRNSLEDLYRPTAVDPARFSWRSIADANFNTGGLSTRDAQNTINQILRQKGWGVKVTPPNYAFKHGLHILIPDQKARFKTFAPVEEEENLWFAEVFDKGWKVFRGMDDPEVQMSTTPLDHGHKPQPIPLYELKKIIQKGAEMRREAREVYRPS